MRSVASCYPAPPRDLAIFGTTDDNHRAKGCLPWRGHVSRVQQVTLRSLEGLLQQDLVGHITWVVKPRFALCDVAQKQPVGFSPRTSASRSRCLERLGQQSPGCSQQVDGTQPPSSSA